MAAHRDHHRRIADRAVVAYGFDEKLVGLDEVLAITTATNLRYQAVMRRLGMTHDPAKDFDDPTVPEGPLRRNVVYGIRADAWV